MVEEGVRPNCCGLLLKGFAHRQKLLSDGSRQIISIHIPGEFIDLQNCFLDVADHNVQAVNRTEVALVPVSAIRELTARPAVARAIWMDTLVDASIFREWVVNVGRRDARARIAHLLCELALRLEVSGQGKANTYPFPLTQDQLADATGLTPVHTNRTLQALRRDKVITLTSGELTVLDHHRLCEIAGFSERYLHHAV